LFSISPTFFYRRLPGGDHWRLQRSSDGSSYTLADEDVVPIAAIPTAEGTEAVLAQRPTTCVPSVGSLHLFRGGIRPVYTDPHHVQGGHYKMQAVTAGVAPRCWARLTHAFTHGEWPHGHAVTGVTYMRAHQTLGFKVWLSDLQDKGALRNDILATLSPHHEIQYLKFSPHKYILHPDPQPAP
jgi:hypothetical protein